MDRKTLACAAVAALLAASASHAAPGIAGAGHATVGEGSGGPLFAPAVTEAGEPAGSGGGSPAGHLYELADGSGMDLTQILSNHRKFNERTMGQLAPWPDEMVVSGDLRHWQEVVYKGEQIVGAIWMSKAGKLTIEGYPYDQMVLILEGSVTVHPVGGQPATYTEGDVFFVSKGYTGTWEMPGDYKELIIVERKIWVEIEGE